MKNKAKLAQRNNIPATAQGREELSEPFTAFSEKRLLR